ncbi:helix-turn-helix domain-containing protein [Frankia sp. Cpl3]|nr:helix-turn-helix domain-containing protein [Frankia sp. Cpl3]
MAKWRNRFAADRLEGLSDEPRPGRPGTVSDSKVHEMITKMLEQAPSNGGTHWSSRSMAKASGLSQSTVSRTKTADQIPETLAAYCERTNDSGHLETSRVDLVIAVGISHCCGCFEA